MRRESVQRRAKYDARITRRPRARRQPRTRTAKHAASFHRPILRHRRLQARLSSGQVVGAFSQATGDKFAQQTYAATSGSTPVAISMQLNLRKIPQFDILMRWISLSAIQHCRRFEKEQPRPKAWLRRCSSGQSFFQDRRNSQDPLAAGVRSRKCKKPFETTIRVEHSRSYTIR